MLTFLGFKSQKKLCKFQTQRYNYILKEGTVNRRVENISSSAKSITAQQLLNPRAAARLLRDAAQADQKVKPSAVSLKHIKQTGGFIQKEV